MRVLFLEAPTALLEQRARLGIDRWDEVWEGVLHVAPAPSPRHQKVEFRLSHALEAGVRVRHLEITTNTEVHRPGGAPPDYRIPDIVVYRPEDESDRGVEGRAVLVVEIRSPGDESYEKLPFYRSVGVEAVLIVEPDMMTCRVWELVDDTYVEQARDDAGALHLPALGVALTSERAKRLTVEVDGVTNVIERP